MQKSGPNSISNENHIVCRIEGPAVHGILAGVCKWGGTSMAWDISVLLLSPTLIAFLV